jgi:outer membrane protein OmpA-like peptidoglycan-associated protein
LKTVTQPKISRNTTNYICLAASFIFVRNGYTEEAPKLTSQKYFLVQDGKTVDTIETAQSQAVFEKKSSYLNTTLSCMIQVGQESLVSNVSSLNSKLMSEANEIKRAELKRLDTKYYADRTAAYAKKDKEFVRIAEIKNLEISVAKTSSAILLASSKYRKAFTAASDLWKAELKKATTDRDAAREVAQTNYLDFLENSGVSIYPRAAAPVVTPTPTPTPTPSPTATTNPQPTVQMKKVGTVYMASGSYQLSAETKKQLVAVAKTINASAAKTILVYGHTDIRGGVNNTLLSQNRAKAVAAYLRPLLKVKKISIGWYASRKPLNTGNSPAALAQNRRVEIYTK